MSDQSLKSLLERINSDAGFADRLRDDPDALSEYDLSTVELFALTCRDTDALGRLVGESVDYRRSAGYRDAMMAAFDPEVASEFETEAAAGGKTSQVTSQTVTVCCWG